MASTINLSGLQRDIVMDQGSSIKIDFSLTDSNGSPLNMTGYDVRLQVRKSYGDNSSPLINATLANSKLAWTSQVGGTFFFTLQPADTSSISFAKDSPDVLEGVYDLEIQSPVGFVSKPVKGSFTLNREVTR